MVASSIPKFGILVITVTRETTKIAKRKREKETGEKERQRGSKKKREKESKEMTVDVVLEHSFKS